MREQIRKTMAQTWGIAAADIPDDAAMNSLERWDSLGQIELMLALETEFGVTMSAQDVLDLSTFEAIEDFLSEKAQAVR